ncbi:MAG TPA: DNA mismatch repair protein [Polyangiaceae bacterium]|nr:DNA mismatch repair protein [Polyangiaceae bacterium]
MTALTHGSEASNRPPAAVGAPGAVSSMDSGALPDLLDPIPTCRIDREQVRVAIVLAFSGGTSGGLFAEALDRAAIAPSSWDPSSYARDIFLSEFVSQCFKVRIGRDEYVPSTGYLVKLLASPPRDTGVVAYRRSILAELCRSPELRKEIEQIYLVLRRLRTRLEAATGVGRWGAQRRQLEILELIKTTIDCMAGSHLSRLRAYGARLAAGEPYRSLKDLLAYDEHLATLDLKLRLGADGSIRGFEILAVQENESNPFVASPLRRWLTKLELFARGYRFNDSEVMARLIDAVFDGLQDEVVPLVQLLGDLEFYLGAMGFRDVAHAAGLEVCLPDLVAPSAPRRLTGLFNPLLFAQRITIVPCDVEIDRHDTTVLVTGPNSGGKTRLLQAIGLCQLLAQSGVFIPARAGTLAYASSLVVSLIQETRADQAEGRLGMELMRIRELFERLPPGAMVILDELCSGTNPSEGEEIFELVLRMLTRLRPQTFITTHFLAFAARLEQERKIKELRFLQVHLGPDHQPTYTFSTGVARTSLAGQAAARLGVTGDQLMALIERNLSQRQNTSSLG